MVKIFQYGSNMDIERMVKRFVQKTGDGNIKDLGIATLPNHELLFNLYSKGNNCAAANFDKGTGDLIGRIFEINNEQLRALDSIEGAAGHFKNYKQKQINVPRFGNVLTYVGADQGLNRFTDQYQDALPSNDYLSHIVKGLAQIKAPLSYVNKVVKTAKPNGAHGLNLLVSDTYDNKKTMYSTSIGLNKKARHMLNLEVGDFVEVQHNDKTTYLQVKKASKELITGPYKVNSDYVVQLSRKARKVLGIEKQYIRHTEGFSSVYDAILIQKI